MPTSEFEQAFYQLSRSFKRDPGSQQDRGKKTINVEQVETGPVGRRRRSEIKALGQGTADGVRKEAGIPVKRPR